MDTNKEQELELEQEHDYEKELNDLVEELETRSASVPNVEELVEELKQAAAQTTPESSGQ